MDRFRFRSIYLRLDNYVGLGLEIGSLVKDLWFGVIGDFLTGAAMLIIKKLK